MFVVVWYVVVYGGVEIFWLFECFGECFVDVFDVWLVVVDRCVVFVEYDVGVQVEFVGVGDDVCVYNGQFEVVQCVYCGGEQVVGVWCVDKDL